MITQGKCLSVCKQADDNLENKTLPANSIVFGMSSRCPFVISNLIGMRTWQRQTKPLVVSERAPEPRSGSPPLGPHFHLHCAFLASQLSGSTIHVLFSFTNHVLFSAGPDIQGFGYLNSLSIFHEVYYLFCFFCSLWKTVNTFYSIRHIVSRL